MIGHVELRGSACSPNASFHFQPRGLAVTKNSRRLLVTSFFSFQRPGVAQVNDQGRQGIVCRININTRSKRIRATGAGRRSIPIGPQETGFTVDTNGDGVPDPASAWPNQMQSIVIRGDQAYLPNIAASPEGPLRFNLDEAFVNVINGISGGSQSDGSDGKFVNLHLGARKPEAGKKKLFFANPWAIAFTNQSGHGAAYVVSAGSDLLVKVNVAGNGKLSNTVDATRPATSTSTIRRTRRPGRQRRQEPAGHRDQQQGHARLREQLRLPQRLGGRPADRPGDQGDPDRAAARARVAGGGRPVGAEMFFCSRGNFNRPAGTTVSTNERLSSEGWQTCASCHFKGLTDSIVWPFGTGPRKSVPLNATFNPHNRNQQRILNYSAIFDEVEDFEANIRNVSGPGPLAARWRAAHPPPAPAPALSTPTTAC